RATPFIYYPPLLLPSLRLFIPPLRLVSAAMWHVVQRGSVHDYGMVEEFISTVTEIVPDLLNADQKAQLLLGLRARSLTQSHTPSRRYTIT
uniref:TERF1-interacting nuclear factor 2 N-terminal domain-containing protein n=1 Tax=Neolamprologus brichardi TaxID=32507 RepID=A0A3Q4H2Z6_NEOBR